MGTHYHGSEEEVRALNAFINLMRAAESLGSDLAKVVARDGLTLSQFGVLEALYHLGPMHQVDISRKLLRSSGNITVVIDNLEKRDLVRRRRRSNDRRFVTVELTRSGRRLIARSFPKHARAITERMSVLEPEELERLRKYCRRIGRKETGGRKDGQA